MKNMKVRAKLIFSFMIVALLAMAVGTIGIIGMQRIDDSGTYMYESIVLTMPEMAKVEEYLLTARIHVREMIIASLSGNLTKVESEFQYIVGLLTIMETHMDSYLTLITDDEARQLFQEARLIYENNLTPVVLSIYAASQTADIPTIVINLERCIIYSDQILEKFTRCFNILVGNAELLSFSAGELSRTLLTLIIIALAIAFGATIFLAIYISSMISGPIGLLNNAFEKVSTGDLTPRLFDKGKDEIASVSRSFNITMEKIMSMIRHVIMETKVITDMSSDLASNMNETAAAMNQITANIQNSKQSMINQSASVTETNATMEQITTNINKLNGHVEVQTSSVSQSSSAIEEMLANIQSVTQTLIRNSENVEKLTEASELGRTGLQDVASDIQEIAKESEGLLEINSVMENIASQTNLLSMNAAIEAAHAGEAGKGFAVVAEEIRKLAENSSEQSKTISTVLKKIKSSIDKIILSADNVLKRFEAIDSGVRTVAEQEENIRNSMEEQGQGSKQILESIGHLNETTQQVKGGSMEMLEGAKEVMREANNLEKSTQEITGGMNEMASGADQVNTAVNHINDLTNKNRETAEKLMTEVQKFKID